MPTKFRIPPADLSTTGGRLATRVAARLFGQAPDGLAVYWHHRQVLRAVGGFEGKVRRWKALDPTLKAYAELASAAAIGCSWCMDFGYYLAHTEGLDLAKLRQVPQWRDATVFTDLERDVIDYAESMTVTPPTTTDEQMARLVERLGPRAMVELTQIVALENMRSRFNAAVGLEDQGYSSVCEIPLVPAATRDSVG